MQVFRSILSKVCCVNVCMYRMSLVSVIIMLPANACHLKVKRNEIWTIFLLKNTYKKVICTNIKRINPLKLVLCELWHSTYENPTISESFTKTNQKWPRLEWKRIIAICDVNLASLSSLSLFQSFSGVY